MSSVLWIGTSWKMNKTIAEARAYARTLAAAPLPAPPRAQVFVIPPFTALFAVREALQGSDVLMGAQTMHEADEGAFTGEVSPVMVRDAGCALVEIGHSERRSLFNETDLAVNAKVRAALRHGLQPLVCVGEDAAERATGAERAAVLRQAVLAFGGVGEADLARCLLAYEPVWAIGARGTPARPEDAAPVHAALKDRFPNVPVLYGGSVSRENAGELAATPGVDGLFVGRAALAVDGLLAILQQALAARGLNPVHS